MEREADGNVPHVRPRLPRHPATSVAELELAVERICRLVLHAQALADRMDGLEDGTAPSGTARAERVRRLRAAVERGAQVLQRIVWQHLDRRSQGERRGSRPPAGS